jgi:hypothetical protein
VNQNDLNNLEFIMSLNVESIKQWWDSISEDDREYAMELLEHQKRILVEKKTNICLDADITDMTQAKQLLSKWCKKIA